MKTVTNTKKIARHGFINDLAKLCGCNRLTVSNAIYNNSTGKKADFVRKMYRTNYRVAP
jgi:hypothetical protein